MKWILVISLFYTDPRLGRVAEGTKNVTETRMFRIYQPSKEQCEAILKKLVTAKGECVVDDGTMKGILGDKK